MLKVVHLITTLRAGGAETTLYRLLSGMDTTRFTNVVVSLTGEGELSPAIRALGVPVHALNLRASPASAIAVSAALLRVLRRERPDIVQTWLYHSDLLGTLAARAAGVPVLAWNLRCSVPRAGASLERPGPLLRLLSRLSRVPDAVVVNAEAGRAFHAAVGFRPREWRLIPNGIDVREFRPSAELRARTRGELGVDPAVPVVGMVGRYDLLKDVDTFLRAARALLDRRPDAVFVLAGRDLTAQNAELDAQIRALGLEGAVRLLGRRTEVETVYPAFDVAALTSRAEGFPNVVAEAMACGVPCAVTDVGDAALLVGETGRVVPPGDPQAMAAAWAGLLSLAPADRARLGAAARDRIAADFSLRAAVDRYEALYERLGARSGRGSRATRAVAGQAAGEREASGAAAEEPRPEGGPDADSPRPVPVQAATASGASAERPDAPGRNADPDTVAGFGAEWAEYDQSGAPSAELQRIWEGYFRVFPWNRLPAGAQGFDLGCGSGRWARRVAPRVGRLHCIDASAQALEVARRNLAGLDNCEFHHASVDDIPLPDGSMDFGYSLGVLHHVPDTAAGLRSCVAKLKPGAPFLVYLYYAFDQRPAWYRTVWRASDRVRARVSRMPHGPKVRVTRALALGVYWPLARSARLLERVGMNVDSMPLSAYRDRSLYTMQTDALDRFGTRLEKRFTRAQIEEMMRDAGLRDIRFNPGEAFWTAVGFRA